MSETHRVSEDHLLWCPGREHPNTLVLDLLGDLFGHARIWRTVTENLTYGQIVAKSGPAWGEIRNGTYEGDLHLTQCLQYNPDFTWIFGPEERAERDL